MILFSLEEYMNLKKHYENYLFIAPSLLLLFVFVVLPVIYAFYLSFCNYDLINSPDFIGLSNYIELLKDKLFYKSLFNTICYTIGSVIVGLSLALLIATLLSSVTRGVRFFQTAYFFPSMTSAVVSAMIFLWIFDYDLGISNYFLNIVNLGKVPWLIKQGWAMASIIMVGSWRGISYNIPIFFAAVKNVPLEYYEAATIDGAKPCQQFFYISIPCIRHILVYAVVMAIIGSFQVIASVDVLTDGGPMNSTLVSIKYIYQVALLYNRMGYASAISIMIFLILLVFTYRQIRNSFESS